jgi:hypothetical protein
MTDQELKLYAKEMDDLQLDINELVIKRCYDFQRQINSLKETVDEIYELILQQAGKR